MPGVHSVRPMFQIFKLTFEKYNSVNTLKQNKKRPLFKQNFETHLLFNPNISVNFKIADIF